LTDGAGAAINSHKKLMAAPFECALVKEESLWKRLWTCVNFPRSLVSLESQEVAALPIVLLLFKSEQGAARELMRPVYSWS
jgi:hypothetical protein